jgi:phenylacetate-CoA ligase
LQDYLKSFIKKNKYIERICREIISMKPFIKRCSKDFWDYYNLLNSVESLDINKVRELQFQQLRDLLNYSYKNSLFYQRLFDEHGVILSQIQSFEDFKKDVPIVNKAMIRESQNITIPIKGMKLVTTSGTTGSPFQFYIDPAGNDKEMAAIFYQWARIGFKPGDCRIEMRGYQEEPIVHYPDKAVVRFSIINMEKNIHDMVSYINRSGIKFIHGYPSAIYKFILLLKRYNLVITHPIMGVMLASENVYDWQINEIEEGLKPKALIAHYGNAEEVALGAWCEKNQAYHFIPLYGYVEKGERNELIGTGFINKATPLIRYQMTDTLDNFAVHPCSDCRRTLFPVVDKIGGRIEEYLVNENDELIPPAVVTFPFKHLEVIKGIQIIQLEDKNILIKYLGQDSEELKHEIKVIVRDLQPLFGNSIRVNIEYVQDIPLNDNCKFKWIINRYKYSSMKTIY